MDPCPSCLNEQSVCQLITQRTMRWPNFSSNMKKIFRHIFSNKLFLAALGKIILSSSFLAFMEKCKGKEVFGKKALANSPEISLTSTKLFKEEAKKRGMNEFHRCKIPLPNARFHEFLNIRNHHSSSAVNCENRIFTPNEFPNKSYVVFNLQFFSIF